jgi:hypothetical protein
VRRRERFRYVDPEQRFADAGRTDVGLGDSGIVVGTYAV